PLPIGTFRFELTFSVEDRVAYDYTTITIQPNPVPNVQIVLVSDSYPTHNPRRPLILHGIVLDGITPDISYQWSMLPGNLVLNETKQRELYIGANMLHEPEYSFQFSATNADGIGFAEFSIKIAQPPTGGTIKVHPADGTIRSLLDRITLSTSGWVTTEDQLPLQYMFYINDGDEYIPLNVVPTSRTTLPSFLMPYYAKPQTIRF